MTAESFDHYFWGLDASKSDQQMYFIRIYHECNDLEWLVGKRIQIDLDGGEKKIRGVVENTECMKKPPYRSGDVVAVMLKK